MKRGSETWKRRAFIQSGLWAAAGAGAAGSLLAKGGAPEGAAAVGSIPVRRFGKTGLTLPILGFGGSALVSVFSSAYGVGSLPADERSAMVRYAYDRGVRYFDTARAYLESETIFGNGLKGVRSKVYLATKAIVTDPAQVRRSVETSLKELQTDYLDCVQIHGPAIDRVGFEGAMKLHAELAKLRDEKIVRFIGLTTHDGFEPVLQLISTGAFDQVLLAYGYFRKGMGTLLSSRKIEYRELCLAKAHELNMAIVVMKVLGANILSHNAQKLVPAARPEDAAQLPAAAIRWVLQDERVSMLDIGVSMKSDIDQNIATLAGNLRFSRSDGRLLADFCAKAYDSDIVKAMKLT